MSRRTGGGFLINYDTFLRMHMKRAIGIVLSLIFFTLLISCGVGKSSSTSYVKKAHKKQNSYYYYMMSQLTNRPETIDESESFLDLALKKDKKSAFLWSQKALAVARNSDWAKALAFAKKAIEKDPHNEETLVLLGKLYAAKKEPQTAISYYKKALALNKQNEEVYNVIAREYLSLNSVGNAYHWLTVCLREVPEAMSCMYYMATIYLEQKNYNMALRYFGMISEQDPDNPKVLQTVGEIYLQQGQYQKALDVFSQLKKLYPQDATYYIRSGLTYYELKQMDEAIEEFLSVVKRFPKSDRVNYFLGLLYMEKKNFDKALVYLDRVSIASPLFKEALSRLLYIMREKNDVYGAVNLIDKKINKKEQTIEFYQLKLSLLVHAQDYKNALKQANDALDRFERHENLLFQRAIILDKINRWHEAKKDLLTILKEHPESEQVLNYLGYTMLEREDNIEEAERYILKALKLKPNDGHVVDSLGWLYFKKEEFDKALRHLHRANLLRPNESAILEHIGDVYFALKNKRMARQFFEKALNLLEALERKSPDDESLLKSIKEKLGAF
ncbi:tetratricopeptide repeat protein [bacterium]|nr:tetratricopeptide repeat protein [bacterium]